MLKIPHLAFAPRLAASVSILAVLVSTSVLPAQSTYTWSGSGTIMNTQDNWSPVGLPNNNGDTAVWNGSQAGPLSLTWNNNWTPNSGNNPGVNILVTSTQTNSLTMTGSGANPSTGGSLGLQSFEVQSGAGAVSVGVGVGSFILSHRGGTTTPFTNNSANTVTFGDNITGWVNGGGANVHNVIFGGSGNWQIDGNYTTIATGGGANPLTKDGVGTLTFNGGTNGKIASAPGTTLATITINQGTVKFGASAQITSDAAFPGVYSSTITNDGTFEWASSANQTLSGVMSGTGTLVQSGAGALTLSGSNTYSGATTLTAGTLVLGTGGSITDSTLVDLNAGATFDTTAQDFDMLGSQTFNFTIDATGTGSAGLLEADTLDITAGVVTFDTIGILDDSVYVLANYGSLVGAAFASVTAPAGYTINYNYGGGNQIALEMVPEPNALALLLGGLGIIAIFRRRRA